MVRKDIDMMTTEQTDLKNLVDQVQIVPVKLIETSIKNMIYVVRNQQVMIDSDLAMLYQAIKRNINRFPENFIFQLTKEEYDVLRSQIATLKNNEGRGTHRKYLPYVFTEQGIAMYRIMKSSKIF